MNESEARLLWTQQTGTPPLSLRRCTTGLCQSVFRVQTKEGSFAWRVASEATAPFLTACVGWLPRLQAVGLPVPKLVDDRTGRTPASVVLSWIEGDDLGAVYEELSPAQRRSIAREVAGLDDRVARLGLARGYGFLASGDHPAARPTWKAVLEEQLTRSRQRLEASRAHDPALATPLETWLGRLDADWAGVEPRPFLDDATTKNVLVAEGKLGGVVDFDWLGHGDRWFAPALTEVSLLAAGRSPEYVEAWVEAWTPTPDDLRRFAFYRGLFCLNLLSEQGQTFNRDEAEPVDRAVAARLKGGLAHSLARLERL